MWTVGKMVQLFESVLSYSRLCNLGLVGWGISVEEEDIARQLGGPLLTDALLQLS